MSIDEKQANLQRFIAAFNNGDAGSIDTFIADEFFNYAPRAGEETATEVCRQLGADLRTAFPDFQVAISDLTTDDAILRGQVTLSGTHKDTLWGLPGTGKHTTWTVPLSVRFIGDKFTFNLDDLTTPDILGIGREIGLIPPPEDMDKPIPHPTSLPEIILRMAFTGQMADKACAHLDDIAVTTPTTDVCQQCVELGTEWPALRMCLICGFTGCCDTAKHKHMQAHYKETGHSIFRSIRLDESWIWCYEDNAFFSGKVLNR